MEFEKLAGIIADVLDISESKITTETAFADLDADSLDLYQIITAISDEFGIDIPDEEAETITTVGDALEKIKQAL